MPTDSFDIHYVADLARLALTPDEEQRLGAQLHQILGYVEQLRAVDISQVEPTSHPFPLTNVTRPDLPQTGLDPEIALQTAPRQRDGLFLVPRIVE